MARRRPGAYTPRVPSARAALARLALVAATASALACAPRVRGPRNILLVTIDTLRSDRIGVYGNPRVLTPALDGLAARGVLFSEARCQIPSTLPSHASILTGRYPPSHAVHDNGVYFLAPEETTLAEVLSAAGFETAGFVGAFVLDRRFGIDQGFETFGDRMEDPLRRGAAPALGDSVDPVARWWVGSWFGPYQRRGEAVVREAAAWLRAREASQPGRPFFLWVHLFDPHEPYDAPPPIGTMYDEGYDGPMDGTGDAFEAARRAGTISARDIEHMRARYDGEVTYADRALGALLDTLATLGLDATTLVAVTADHGEGMGEHGYYFEHGSRLWETILAVPLVVAGPGIPRGRVVPGRVRSVDLLPSLVAAVGVPAPGGVDGAAIDLRHPRPGEDRDSYAEAQCGLQAMPVPESHRAYASGRWKLIAVSSRDPRRQGAPPSVALFDLAEDAGETADLAAARPRVANDLLADIAETWRRGAARSQPALNTRAMDEETVAKLRALGYVK